MHVKGQTLKKTRALPLAEFFGPQKFAGTRFDILATRHGIINWEDFCVQSAQQMKLEDAQKISPKFSPNSSS